MNLIFEFFRKFKNFGFFLLLQIISVVLIINRSDFHNLVFNQNIITFNSWYSGNIKQFVAYFQLKEKNQELLEENSRLRAKLYGIKIKDSLLVKKVNDSLRPFQKYELITAKVTQNSIIHKDNFFYINRGREQGVEEDMGVITSKGIAGQIYEVAQNHSKVMSALNTKIIINSRLKGTNYFGSLVWEAEDTRLMHLYDIPKYTEIAVGDTVETANSMIFPDGIPVGRIAGKRIKRNSGNWDISVELFQEMIALDNVDVVRKLERNIELKSDSIVSQRDTVVYVK
ncbi:MAG: rod shape-determining protein MreC [Flavobacteriales bacterium]|nr:rod shape-determining protein MreC [Flavobacteriales bacterium]